MCKGRYRCYRGYAPVHLRTVITAPRSNRLFLQALCAQIYGQNYRRELQISSKMKSFFNKTHCWKLKINYFFPTASSLIQRGILDGRCSSSGDGNISFFITGIGMSASVRGESSGGWTGPGLVAAVKRARSILHFALKCFLSFPLHPRDRRIILGTNDKFLLEVRLCELIN